ncbi:MAG: LysR family transcriptional regulator [Chlamydiales bacterium]|nr:LysR family transcriptional regulator [Chlamydiales bacterium]
MVELLDAYDSFKDEELHKIEQSLKSLRIADLELFISAAQMKSLGKSAQAHHLSQSGASAAIQRVETAFGLPLCTHEKRQFRLTHQGQALLPRLETWLEQIRTLVLSKNSAPIRLVTTHAIAQIAVPSLLSIDTIEFKHMRPDHAYRAILQDEADIALVLDNAPWQGVIAAEVGKGYFQLYSKEKNADKRPVLLPEDQMEVLALKQSWQQLHGFSIPIKATIPSWSLIATICSTSTEIGFLPDFLGKIYGLYPVLWQPSPSPYRILAIHRTTSNPRIEAIIHHLHAAFV